MSQEIKRLEALIEAEKRKMASCKHTFGAAYSNPETTREPYGSVMEVHGSDVWHNPAGYHDVTKPRWTRVCSTCGKEEHTYKQKPIIKGYEPDF